MDRTRTFERESGLEIYALGARRDAWVHALKQFDRLVIEDCIQTLINHGYTDAAQCLRDIHFGISAP